MIFALGSLACESPAEPSDRTDERTVAIAEVPGRRASSSDPTSTTLADPSQPAPAGITTGDEFEREGRLLDEAERAIQATDYRAARVQTTEAIAALLARPEADQSERWLEILERAARSAWDAQDARTAKTAWEGVLGVRARALPDDHPDLQVARANLAIMSKVLGDSAAARLLEEKVVEVFSRTLAADHSDLQRARLNLAGTLFKLGDLRGARELLETVLEVFTRTLPDDHPDLQTARGNLALAMKTLGDLAGARELEEMVLEVRSRTLPEDHPELQKARLNLASTIYALGDLTGALDLQEKVLEVRERTLPEGHPHLDAARQNLAATMMELGDLAGARALNEKVLEVRSGALPDDHPDLQAARLNLAATIHRLGDIPSAQALEEKVLEVYSRTLPDDHPDLQAARMNLAATISSLGDLAGARVLQEKVLETYLRTLPDDHPDLQGARLELAGTKYSLGDLAAARELQDKVLETYSRKLPDDHPHLQAARSSVAMTLRALGDDAGARALHEKVLEVRSRTLPDDHPDLQAARHNLAITIYSYGDIAGARALFEKVVEVFSRTRHEDHRDLQIGRSSLAVSLHALGDLEAARALQERVLEVDSRTLPQDHPGLQVARENLALTIKDLADLAGARALQESVLEVRSRTLPDDHHDLENARRNLAWTLAGEHAQFTSGAGEAGDATSQRPWRRERCAELLTAVCRGQTSAARDALSTGSLREAEGRCERISLSLGDCLSFADGLGPLEPFPELEGPAFVLGETTRGAALGAAASLRLGAASPRYAALRATLSANSVELAKLAQQGTTSEAFQRALAARDRVQQDLVALGRELSNGCAPPLELDVDLLGAGLDERDAIVAYRVYARSTLHPAEPSTPSEGSFYVEKSVESLCATVLRRRNAADSKSPAAVLTRVQLGPIGPIAQAVSAWRDALGVAGGRGVGPRSGLATSAALERAGKHLRELVLDPLLPSLGDAERLILVSDGILHLVAFDALPAEGVGGECLGDRRRIEHRATVSEILWSPALPACEPSLLTVGGVRYDAPAGLPSGVADAGAGGLAVTEADLSLLLRGGAWGAGFTSLGATREEAERVGVTLKEAFGSRATWSALEGSEATKERLSELARGARFLHVATHGWFASESIRSWEDEEPLDKLTGLVMRRSGEDQVKGMSPMLLCGLALAGANLPQDELGGAPGLITAEEIATLDLSSCELAVLSACDTNVGEPRAGQGVASLQKALQMAGARSVITSLWKVPDEATRELMTDFYRRIWVEKKPKSQALWEAKRVLRDAQDETGHPRYSTRDWAAWVLTGEPN